MSETISASPATASRGRRMAPGDGSLSLGDKCAIGVGVLLCLGMYR